MGNELSWFHVTAHTYGAARQGNSSNLGRLREKARDVHIAREGLGRIGVGEAEKGDADQRPQASCECVQLMETLPEILLTITQ